MGTRIEPEPPSPGDNCAWFITPASTPVKIYAMFWSIGNCPGGVEPPNYHLFSLFQDDVNACLFRNVLGALGWQVQLQFVGGPQRSVIHLWDNVGNAYFYNALAGAADEHDVFTNEIIACTLDDLGIGGFAMIFWLDAVYTILNALNLPNDGHTFMEFSVTDEKKPVYKFCNTRWLLNKKILYSP